MHNIRNYISMLSITVMTFAASLVEARDATKHVVYEVISNGEASFQNCISGQISEAITSIKEYLNATKVNSRFGIVCVPKRYIVDDPEKKTIVLVPFSSGNEISLAHIRFLMKVRLLQLPTCAHEMQTCIDPEAFERLAYEYTGSNVFPSFTRDAYGFESFVSELTSPTMDQLLRVTL